MLFSYSNLKFPKLIRLRDTKFESWGKDGTTQIYKLEWPEGHYLPEPYDTWFDKLVYAIPYKYMVGIRQYANLARYVSNIDKPFDSAVLDNDTEKGCIRDIASLLKDCVFDQNTEYFYRGDDRCLVQHAFMYKFWSAQVGYGMIQRFAHIPELIELYSHTYDDEGGVRHTYAPMVDDFVESLVTLEKDITKRTEEFASSGSDKSSGLKFDDVDFMRRDLTVAKEQCHPEAIPGWTPKDGHPRNYPKPEHFENCASLQGVANVPVVNCTKELLSEVIKEAPVADLEVKEEED